MYTSPRTSISAGGSGIVEPQRDRWDRPQVVGDVLADLAVAARRPPLEFAVRYSSEIARPSIFGSTTYSNCRVLDPLAGEVVAHPLRSRRAAPRRVRAFASDSIAWGWRTFSSSDDRLAAGPLRRRVGRDQLGVLGLDRPQLIEQRVVLVVADLGIVEDVVAVAVVVELLSQLDRALGRRVRNPRPQRGRRRDQPRQVVAL